ncbi:MAG: ATP-binding protein [Rhodobacteraceae bacterium]|nr:ATP-binding protein [Paracoccaceae bacterium]
MEFLELTNAFPDPVLIVDRNMHIIGANGAAKSWYNVDLIGQSLYAFVRQPNALACIRRARESGGSCETRISELRHEADTDLRFYVKPIKLHNNGAEVLLITLLDVTDISEAELVRRDFVANVSHELRSPLTSLCGFIETLKSSDLQNAELCRRFLDIMDEEAKRMSRLIDDLLSLSKVEAQERVRPSDMVCCSELLQETVDSISRAEEVDTSRICLQCPREALVYGDREQLIQVFHNLIENALKYSPSDSRVDIAVKHSRMGNSGRRGEIRVEVRDRGTGFEAVHVPRITERFYRIDKHRSRQVGGTGLGLAIVKHIVNRHRGQLYISSEPGSGSTFAVALPLAEVQQQSDTLLS